MSKKDFVLLASIIKSLKVNRDTRITIAETFAASLGGTNARFDSERFIGACIN